MRAVLLSLFLLCSTALAAPIKVVDDIGTTVTVDSVPSRVVCLSPGATEIIYALGAGGLLTGVCSLCDYPPEARRLPRVGDFMDLSLEAILAARPGLVVATGGIQKEIVLRLRDAGIPTVVLYPHGILGVYGNISLLGALLGRQQEARALVSRMSALVKKMTARQKRAMTGSRRPRVYFEVSSNPLMAAGGKGYLGDLIWMAGGENVARNTADEFPRMSPEFIIASDPEVIILSHAADPAHAVEELRQRPGWADVSAVKEGRVYADLDMDMLMRPGPRLVMGLSSLQRRIIPPK